MSRLQLSGGAYQARSVIASAQRSLNLYAEPMGQVQGEPSPFAYYPTAGTTTLLTLGDAPVRGLFRATNDTLYAVSGATVYSISSTWSATSLGSITAGLTTPVSMSDNGTTLVIVDGTSNGWQVTLANNAFSQITDSTASFRGGDRVDYLDTFMLFNVPGTPQFQSTLSNAITFDALYFANKESHSDLLVSVVVIKREIWLLGETTSEVWYNSGDAAFPFASQPGAFIDQGCCAKYSVATSDNAVYWLSQDRNGMGIVMQGAGYSNQRVSTYPIEYALTTYPTITDAIGFCYQYAGHRFYCLTFPTADKTWLYDATTQQWSELAWIDSNGTEHRHRANCAAYCYGTIVVGDWLNGNVYALDPNVYTDFTGPVKRARIYPHLLRDGHRVFYRQFLCDMETGTTLTGPATTTITTYTPIWPPQIASLTIPSDGVSGTINWIVPDWGNGRLFAISTGTPQGIRAYTTSLATQSPAVSVAYNSVIEAAAVDPASGDLIVNRNTPGGLITNGLPFQKLDPTSLAVLATYGTSTSTPSYPTSMWIAQDIACVDVNGVGYAIIKESATSGGVGVIRTDTMAAAGFYVALVSGATNNRAILCRGATGGSRGTVYLTWQGTVNGYTASIPLYVVVILAGAETYNIASWPTANADISAGTVGTIAAASVDAGWSHIAAYGIGYDRADGNVLLDVRTNDAVSNQRYIVKVNAGSAAVMWRVAVTNNNEALNLYNVANSTLWLFGGGVSTKIDTATGGTTVQTLNGISSTSFAGDDASTEIVLFGSYTAGTGAPVAVSGTSNFSNGWALMGGQTASTVTTVTGDDINLVWLSWSDDRGHAYGNPVSVSLGGTGEYVTSLQWQRLGYGRDRTFKIEWSTPVRTALQGAWIDVTPGQS